MELSKEMVSKFQKYIFLMRAGMTRNMIKALEDVCYPRSLLLSRCETAIRSKVKPYEFIGALADELFNSGNPRLAVSYFEKSLKTSDDVLTHGTCLKAMPFSPYLDDDDISKLVKTYKMKYFDESFPVDLPSVESSTKRPIQFGVIRRNLNVLNASLLPAFREFDPNIIELHLFLHEPPRDELRVYGANWHTVDLDNAKGTAQYIRQTGIDVAMFTGGFPPNPILPIAQYRAAPVQTTWYMYPTYFHLTEIDFILDDDVRFPPGYGDDLNDGRLYRNPGFFSATSRKDPNLIPDVPESDPPSRTNGYITFACLSSALFKVNDASIAIWSDILKAVPGSKFLLRAGELHEPWICEGIARKFENYGIHTDRLLLRPHIPDLAEFFRSLSDIDIVLDRWPGTGGSTTIDSIWQGVPALSLGGDWSVPRMGKSTLQAFGMSEFYAETPNEYIQLAKNLANDPERLLLLRQTLRVRMRDSRGSDAKHFAEALTTAIIHCWEHRP